MDTAEIDALVNDVLGTNKTANTDGPAPIAHDCKTDEPIFPGDVVDVDEDGDLLRGVIVGFADGGYLGLFRQDNRQGGGLGQSWAIFPKSPMRFRGRGPDRLAPDASKQERRDFLHAANTFGGLAQQGPKPLDED